jgi:hypothetical protein
MELMIYWQGDKNSHVVSSGSSEAGQEKEI